MRVAPAYLGLALMTSPALAQDMDLIAGCADTGLDTPGCDAEDLAENLGLMGINEVRVFKDIGMESFAMLTAMRYAASAIFFQAEGEGCIAEEERAAAIEIWSLWVALPEDAPRAIAEKYEILDGVMTNIVQMEMEC